MNRFTLLFLVAFVALIAVVAAMPNGGDELLAESGDAVEFYAAAEAEPEADAAAEVYAEAEADADVVPTCPATPAKPAPKPAPKPSKPTKKPTPKPAPKPAPKPTPAPAPAPKPTTPAQPHGYGVDLSYFQGDVSLSTLKCLRQGGARYIVVEGTAGSAGYPNPHAAGVIQRARTAGFSPIDLYLFLNFKHGNPSGQVQAVLDGLKKANVLDHIGTIWHDIEGPQYWGSCSQNVAFIKSAMAEVEKYGKAQAIYTSASQWGPIACNNTSFSKYRLWYAHYDGAKSFGDFSKFAGWSKPSVKQFAGTTYTCGTAVDKNYAA